jgi:hypothetical protein
MKSMGVGYRGITTASAKPLELLILGYDSGTFLEDFQDISSG